MNITKFPWLNIKYHMSKSLKVWWTVYCVLWNRMMMGFDVASLCLKSLYNVAVWSQVVRQTEEFSRTLEAASSSSSSSCSQSQDSFTAHVQGWIISYLSQSEAAPECTRMILGLSTSLHLYHHRRKLFVQYLWLIASSTGHFYNKGIFQRAVKTTYAALNLVCMGNGKK